MMGRPPSTSDHENNLKKGPWTPEEDQKLVEYIQKHGHQSWRALPRLAGLNRCGKSCRLRWTNYLRPDIKRGRFSEEEEQLIINLHQVLGNKWSAIAARLPGRTDNEIKNFWNTHLRKKLLQMGIDPVTHRPRTDHLNILANLPQLLAAANFNNLMNFPTWDNLRLQSDATQLAKIQLLHNILQVLSTSPSSSSHSPSLESVNLLLGRENNQNFSDQLYQFGFSQQDNSNQILSNFLNLETTLPPQTTQVVAGGDTQFGTSSNQQQLLLPALVSDSSQECCKVNNSNNQIETKDKNNYINIIPNDISNPSSTSTTFEANWGSSDHLIDDDASESYWKDFIDQASSQPWPFSE